MTFLVRFSLIWLILGLVVGFFLRRSIKKRLPVVYALSFAPWFVHVIYLSLYTLSRSNSGAADIFSQFGIFVLISFSLSLLFALMSRPYVKRNNLLGLLPVGVLLLYALPLYWYMGVLQTNAMGLGIFPTVALVEASLFAASAVFTLSVSLPTVKPRNFLRRRKP